MSKVSDEQVEAAARALHDKSLGRMRLHIAWADLSAQRLLWLFEDARAALEAVSSIHEAEHPVAWLMECITGPYKGEIDVHSKTGIDDAEAKRVAHIYSAPFPVYRHPAPISKGVTVKPANFVGWKGRLLDLTVEFDCIQIGADPDKALSNAQAIVAEMLEGFDDVTETEAALSHTAGEIEAGGEVERLTKERDAYRDERDNLSAIVASGIDDVAGAELDDLESRAEAADKRIAELTEQAFRDGVAYATNCEVTDVDLAWLQSRVRAALVQETAKIEPVVVTDEMVDRALDAWWDGDWPDMGSDELDGMKMDMHSALTAALEVSK